MFYVPLAQNVDYKDTLMQRVELQSHFISGMMIVTNLAPGVLEPQLRRVLAGVDPNLTVNSIRTMQQQISLTFGQERAVSSLAEYIWGRRSVVGRGWTRWSHRLYRRTENQ